MDTSRAGNRGEVRRCTKCVLPEQYPDIRFDEKGVCHVRRETEVSGARPGFTGWLHARCPPNHDREGVAHHTRTQTPLHAGHSLTVVVRWTQLSARLCHWVSLREPNAVPEAYPPVADAYGLTLTMAPLRQRQTVSRALSF